MVSGRQWKGPQEVLRALVQVETDYISALTTLVHNYKLPLSKAHSAVMTFFLFDLLPL